jgi:hypothetical protein
VRKQHGVKRARRHPSFFYLFHTTTHHGVLPKFLEQIRLTTTFLLTVNDDGANTEENHEGAEASVRCTFFYDETLVCGVLGDGDWLLYTFRESSNRRDIRLVWLLYHFNSP